MPFDVYPIQGLNRNDNKQRTAEVVAEEIKRTYEEVSVKGGQIIASHTLDVRESVTRGTLVGAQKQPYRGESYLFLVADLPEKTGQDTGKALRERFGG